MGPCGKLLFALALLLSFRLGSFSISQNMYGSIPATCYGPEAQNIHGIDEPVSIESTLRVAQLLALFMARWCGVEKTQ